MYLLTSSPYKIAEYKDLGIEARLGEDIEEVLGTIDDVIIYKILSVAPNTLVEDTVLEIEGKQIVDSKFRIRSIAPSSRASWITSLGYHDENNLYVFRGVLNGKIVSPVIEHASSFAPCFVPHGTSFTLYELKQNENKRMFSARRLAVEAYQNRTPTFTRNISEVPKWEGDYQKKEPNR